MAKVLMVTTFTFQKDGETKTGYNVGLQKADGTKITASAYEPIKDGDEIAEDRLHPGKREGEWTIWSEKKGGKGGYPRNDELTVAQCAANIVADLIIHDKMNVLKLNSDTFIEVARAIMKTVIALKVTPATGNAPAHVSTPPAVPSGIQNMGQLRMAIQKAYPILKTISEQDKIIGDPKLITDYEEAFKKVVTVMEGELKW